MRRVVSLLAIRLYKSIPYKIMHNLHNKNYATDFNQVAKHQKEPECEALQYQVWYYVLGFRVHLMQKCIY